jgi:hypothetical protein
MNINITSAKVFTPAQLAASPALTAKTQVNLTQAADGLQSLGTTGALTQGAKDIRVELADRTVVNLKFNVTADGATREDFLAALKQAVSEMSAADLSPSQLKVKKGLADTYRVLSGAPGIQLQNEDALAHKMQSLDQRFQRLMGAQNALSTSTTQDHRLKVVQGAKIKHSQGTDGVPFSEQRQHSLVKRFPQLAQHSLIKNYGLLMAKNQQLLSAQDGLRLAHPRSTTYLRDGHDAVDGLFREVMGKANLPQLVLPDQRFLVNADILEKLEILLGPANNNQSLYHKLLENPPTIEDVGSGLKVLNVRFRAGNLAEQDAFMGETNKLDALKHILNTIGATPSTYIAEAFMQPALAPLASNPALNNDAKVDDILASPAMAELGKLAEQHTGMGAMASASHNLIQGLFGRIPQNQNGNPLIDNALQQIEKLVEVMVASGEQPENFSKAFNFLIEELQIVLAEAKPYTPEHFEGGLSMVRYERLPVLADVPPEGITVGYASSGMDALSTAFAAAKSMHGAQVDQVIQGGDNLNYFEVPELLKGGQLGNANEPIITAALNPSTPQASVNIQELAAKVNRRIEDHNPTTLILDVTIESDKTKLNDLMTALKPKIDDGSLNVILCKSYQKYGSLGSAKIMAGSITMINNGDAKFNDAKQFMTDSCDRLGNLAVDGTGKMIKGESQFLTHLIRCTHPDEIELIKDAAHKAQFIDRFVWPPSSDRPLDSSVASLPFVVRSDAVGTSAAGRLKVVGIEERDSFSFLNTSFLKISPPGSPVFLRLNPGHESPTRMVEQFFAVGHLSSQQEGYPNLVTPALISKKLSMIDLLAMGDVQPHIQALNGVAAHTLQTANAANIIAALLPVVPTVELNKFIHLYVESRGALGPAANRPLPDAIVETALRDLRGGKTELMNKVDFLALPNAADHLQALAALQVDVLTGGDTAAIILAANAGANPARSEFIRSFVAVRGAEALTPAQVYAKTALELRKEPVLRLNQLDLLAIPGRAQHLVALANVQQDTLETGSVAEILAALATPSDQMVTFVHKFVEVRGVQAATPQQIVAQALLDINTVHPDFCNRANFLSFANPMPQIEALAHLNDMALLTTGSSVEIGQRIVENTQTRMAFLALPEQAQRLLDLGAVPEATLKTGSVQQIEQALGAPVAVIPDVLHTFITQFVAVRGDREKTPQEVIAECNHQVQAVYPGTQIVSGNPIPADLVVNADLTSFVTLFTTARGAKQENPMKILQDSKMLFRADQVMPKAEFLDNLCQYQSSMKASLVHLLRTTGNLATAPAKAAVQTAYEKIIAQDFRGDGPDSESISPQTRATIMKDWASFALPALQPTVVLGYQNRFNNTYELLQMHVDDMPAYQRLNALESMDNRVFATPHPGGTGAPLADQQKLVKVLIEGAQAHEVFGLLQDLMLKDPAQPDKTQALLTAIRDLGADLPNGGGLLEGPAVSVPGLTAKAQLLLDPHAQTHLDSIAAQIADPLIALSAANLTQDTADVIIGAMQAPSNELQTFVRNFVAARNGQRTSLDEIRLSTSPQVAAHNQRLNPVDAQILKRGDANAIIAALGMPAPGPELTAYIQTYVSVRDSFDYGALITQQLQGLPNAQTHLDRLAQLPAWNPATNVQTADQIIAALTPPAPLPPLPPLPAPSAELQNFVRDYVRIRNQTIESPADLRQHLLTY